MLTSINLLIPSKRWKVAKTTGDYFFAKSLQKSFEKLGIDTQIVLAPDWPQKRDPGSVDIVLRGYRAFRNHSGNRTALWVIYPGRNNAVFAPEFESVSHAFFASELEAAAFVHSRSDLSATPVLQAFDSEIMFATPGQERSGIIFVGSLHKVFGEDRPIVTLSAAAGIPIELWGGGWSDLPPTVSRKGSFVANDELGQMYRSAEIVLCDHMPSMRNGGYVSNRIFDALACAAPVISDRLPSLPPDFDRFVEMVSTPEEFAAAVDKIRNEGEAMKQERAEFAKIMLERHSFDARARQIRDMIS